MKTPPISVSMQPINAGSATTENEFDKKKAATNVETRKDVRLNFLSFRGDFCPTCQQSHSLQTTAAYWRHIIYVERIRLWAQWRETRCFTKRGSHPGWRGRRPQFSIESAKASAASWARLIAVSLRPSMPAWSASALPSLPSQAWASKRKGA
jgi:hypothetical protein